jgi:hypothetical protein
MKRSLVAAALAAMTLLGATACAGSDDADVATGGTSTPSATGTTRSTASATPTGSAAPTTTSTSTSPANPPDGGGGGGGAGGGGGGGGPADPPAAATPPPPAPTQSSTGENPAFCATFEAILDRTLQMFAPAITLENSTDPAEIEHAWQEIQRIAQEGAALARQASGQTDGYAVCGFPI